MQLFTHCALCHSSCAGIKAKSKGTYVTMKHLCSRCGYQRVWASQSHIKDTPAGNIVLSAAVLYSGERATKFLRVLSHVNIVCITDRTCYIYQREFLEPVVIAVGGTKPAKQCRAIIHLLMAEFNTFALCLTYQDKRILANVQLAG